MKRSMRSGFRGLHGHNHVYCSIALLVSMTSPAACSGMIESTSGPEEQATQTTPSQPSGGAGGSGGSSGDMVDSDSPAEMDGAGGSQTQEMADDGSLDPMAGMDEPLMGDPVEDEEPPAPDTVTPDATLASRATGVAPLAVFFDALSEGSEVIQPPQVEGRADFARFQYEWDFGDPDAGSWETTGADKNRATGPMAGHVFERPGEYRVSLHVTDADGNLHEYTQDIVVSAFDGTTYYVSSSTGSDHNTGLSPDEPVASFEHGVSLANTNTRVLFKRGDEWTTQGNRAIGAVGPGILAAYGEGPKPHIHVTSDHGAIAIRGNDWRVADLRFTSDSGSTGANGVDGDTTNGTRDVLFLRLEVSGFRVGIGWSAWRDGYHENVFVVDSYVHDARVNGMYLGGTHLAVLGTRVQDSETSHVVRAWQTNRSVLNHNVFHNPGGQRHALKLHASKPELRADGWLDSEYTVIAHNDFGAGQWVVAISPQNAQSDERVHDILFEGNTVRAGVDTLELVKICGQRVTARRNVLIGTGSGRDVRGFSIAQRGVEPPPEANHFHDNVAYREEGNLRLTLLRAYNSAADTVASHNLLSYPGASFGELSLDGATSDSNFVVPPSSFEAADAEDFSLAAGSELLDMGFEADFLVAR